MRERSDPADASGRPAKREPAARPASDAVGSGSSTHCRRLLEQSLAGDAPSTREIAIVAYEDMRRQARRMLGSAAGSIDATAIVHDAYLRLIDQRQQDWRNRAHFAAISSTVLRRVLIDALRAQGRRRAQQTRLATGDGALVDNSAAIDLLDLEAALRDFAGIDPQAARIVEMRLFGGLTVREIANELQVPRSSVQDLWTFARSWLGRRLGDGE